MPKQDRNIVALGTTKYSLEDEALARARMSSRSAQVTPPVPPTVAYPIAGFWGEVPWGILDSVEFGGYSLSLLWDSAIFNLANISQFAQPDNWASSAVWSESIMVNSRNARVQFVPRLRSARLYQGAYYRNAGNTDWVAENYAGSYFGTAIQFSAEELQRSMRYGWADTTHTYTTAFAIGDTTYCYMIRIPHTGAFSVEVLQVTRWDGTTTSLNDFGSPRLRILGVYQNYVWAMREPSPSNSAAAVSELNLFNVSTNTRQRRRFYFGIGEHPPSNTIGMMPNGTLFYGGNRPFSVDLNLNLVDSGVQLPGFPNEEETRISLQDIANSAVLSMTSTGFWHITQQALTFVELQQPGRSESFTIAGLHWDPAGIGTDIRWSWVSDQDPLIRFLNKRSLAEVLSEAGI